MKKNLIQIKFIFKWKKFGQTYNNTNKNICAFKKNICLYQTNVTKQTITQIKNSFQLNSYLTVW